MLDLLYIALGIGCFGACYALVEACARLFPTDLPPDEGGAA
ncbi:MAG: hypothetical protein U0636_07980 [Phycisphaerales bacterium]